MAVSEDLFNHLTKVWKEMASFTGGYELRIHRVELAHLTHYGYYQKHNSVHLHKKSARKTWAVINEVLSHQHRKILKVFRFFWKEELTP